MARTLAQLKTICKYHGWDNHTTEGLSELENFINETLQTLSTLAKWPEYCKVDGSVTCAATSATISGIANDGSTATVTTSAAHGLVAGDIIDITATGDDNWNVSDTVIQTVPTTTTFTFDSTVTEADPAAGTVTKQIDNSALSNTRIWRIGSMIRTDRSVPLDELTHEEWLNEKKYHGTSGNPTMYSLQRYEYENTTRTRILIFPEPTSSITLYYTYQVYPKWLSSDSEYTDWPDMRLHLLTQALRIRLSAQDRDAGGVALYGREFMELVRRAQNFARPSNRPFIAKSKPVGGYNTPLCQIEKTFS